MMGATLHRLGRGLADYRRTLTADDPEPERPEDLDPDSPATMHRRVIAVSLVAVPVVAVVAVLNLIEQPRHIAAITLAVLIFLIAVIWWMLDDPTPYRTRTGALIELLGAILLLGVLCYSEPDGLSTPFWMGPVILIAAMILGTRAAIWVTVFAIVSLTTAYTLKAVTMPFAPTVFAEVAITVRRALFLVVLFLMGVAFRRVVDRQIMALRNQRELISNQAEDLATEVAERRRAQDELARSLSVVISHATDGVVTYGADGRIIDVNDTAATVLGQRKELLPGQPLDKLLAPRLARQPSDLLRRLTRPGARVELELQTTEPEWRDSEWAVSSRRTGNGTINMAIVRDVTERKDFEAQLVHEANYDATTGVSKVPHFMHRIDGMLAIQPEDSRQGVLAVGIDDLRTVHDGHGWEFTQEVLKVTADRLVRLLGSDGEVGVFDGVGFLVGVRGPRQQQVFEELARTICATVAEPVELRGNRVVITASVGVAVADERVGQLAADDYVRHAGAALNLARQRGPEQVVTYDEEFHSDALLRLELDDALHNAVTNSEFRLHYQPIVAIDSGAVVGAEALVRWDRPGWGILRPALFLPRLEATGLIVGVGEWVLQEACRELAAWQDRISSRAVADRPYPTMNVNLSALQLASTDLPTIVAKAVTGHQLHPGQLVLEITESAAFAPGSGVLDSIGALRDAGVGVAIDDFGTGYSSLSQLMQVGADAVKLDKSFVDDVTTPRGRAVVSAVLQITRELGAPMVAEGVETDEQLAVLHDLGVDLAQGYLFARPAAVLRP